MKCITHVSLLLIILNFGQSVADDLDFEEHSPARHAVQIAPLGLITGAYGGNYQFMVIPGHSAVIGGSYSGNEQNTGYSMELAYRFHRQRLMASPFFSLFCSYGDMENTLVLEENNKRNKYPYSIQLLKIGANAGKRWSFRHSLNLTGRIGYGLPIMSFKWLNTKPASAKTIETITKFTSGLDLELTTGFCF
jgi:hypothetical protein